eukprot:g45571.t1
MVCCLPGARIKDILERVQNILKEERNQQEVVAHIETNDTGREKDEILRREYRESDEVVLDSVKSVKVSKSRGSDQVYPRTLWEASSVIAGPLAE